MKPIKLSLLMRVVIAILGGVLLGLVMPEAIARIFVTFCSIFGNFLGFCVPLIIVGLVVPAIAELGRGAGRLLIFTALLAYGSTLFSGFFTYFSCDAIFPRILSDIHPLVEIENPDHFLLKPYFTIDMPPLMDVMTALLLAFTVGLGLAYVRGTALRDVCHDAKEVIVMLISRVIVPLLPLHIFGIFLNMTVSGQVAVVIDVFMRVIFVIFALHILLLLIQFCAAGAVARRNPLQLLRNMLPAYLTALGTASSAATIPVTLQQTLKNGVRPEIAQFTIPLCATIHLAGSTMKLVAISMALLFIFERPVMFGEYVGFIMMLGVTMVAAPGVPGGAVMAALGILHSMLGFDETSQALIIAVYMAIDSFGTACNVTGDGAIALVIDRIAHPAPPVDAPLSEE